MIWMGLILLVSALIFVFALCVLEGWVYIQIDKFLKYIYGDDKE